MTSSALMHGMFVRTQWLCTLGVQYINDKRLGTDLVTLSIKHLAKTAIVVEPFLIQHEREYYLAIDGYQW